MNVGLPTSAIDLSALTRMRARLESLRNPLRDATIAETGFIWRDSEDLCAATASVLERFLPPDPRQQGVLLPTEEGSGRTIEVRQAPIGGVAIVLPLNAFPYMAVLAGLSAVAAGNRVWLKAPSSCTASADLVQRVFENEFGGRLEIVTTGGREFVEWALSSSEVQLMHFIGGSEAGSSYLKPAFDAGKSLLVDGDGNCQVFVGPSFEPERAAALLADSAVRFNGQTCTSTVGATVHPDLYETVTSGIAERFSKLKCGNPNDKSVDVGPLFSRESVTAILAKIDASGARIVCGGAFAEEHLAPTLVDSPDLGSDLVRSGVFGPALWIRAGTVDDFESTWKTNRYPLCAGVLTNDRSDIDRIAGLSRLSRLTVNGDTSIEDALEPWGAFPSSGNGRVEPWVTRYSRTLQLDLPA